MAASGFTPVSLYDSTTASAVPTSGNLANGELGLNIADMKLYAKNSAGTVTLLASNSSTGATVSSVSGTGTVSGITLSGTVTSSGSLTLGGSLSLVSPPPIGSTTPNTGAFTTLSATKGSAGLVAFFLSGNAAQSPFISFGRSAEDVRIQIAAATNDLFTGTVAGDYATNSNASIWFGSGGTPILKIASSGNVGIGTSSPSTKLDVATGAGGTQNIATLRSSNVQFKLGTTDIGNGEVYYNVFPTSNSALAGAHIWQGGGSDLMKLSNGGILGLGVAPSAWVTGDFKAVQIGSGGSAVFGGNGAGYSPIGLLSNGYISGGSIATTYSTNGSSAGRYYMQGNNHYWSVAPAGSGTITWTTAMTLDGSSNLTATGSVTAYSDERLKKDWTELPANFVENLAKVKSGTYTRIDNDIRQAGSSAQDWQSLLPEVVLAGEDEDKTLSLAYGNAALVSVIELAKRFVALKAEVTALKGTI